MLIEEYEVVEAENFLFSIVYPNNQGLTPLDLALKDRSTKQVEIMLDMLSYRP